MKWKRILILVTIKGILFLGLSTSSIIAQEGRGGVISTQPLRVAAGEVNLAYEAILKPDMGLVIGVGEGHIGNYPAFTTQAGIKMYSESNAPEGSWYGMFGLLTRDKRGVTIVGGGIWIGYQYLIAKWLAIEGLIAGAYITELGGGGTLAPLFGLRIGLVV